MLRPSRAIRSAGFYEQSHLLMPLRPPLLSTVARDNSPVRSLDAKRDARQVGQPRGHPPVRIFLGVPLGLRGAPIGMIGVANGAGGYAEEHEHLLVMYASQVATAIHNARLYEQVQGIAIAEERARIAREMHDSLVQLLFYVNTQAEAVRTLVRTGQRDRAIEQSEQLAQAAREAYADVREEIQALRTTDVAGSLGESLVAYLPRWQEQSGVRATLLVPPARAPLPTLPPAVDIQLVRLVQEALTNVRKHARAQQVLVRISGDRGQVIVEVEDDGEGFDPAVRERSARPTSGWP